MGGVPTAALALVSLSASDGAASEADLDQVLRGAVAGLERMDVALVGGHTVEAPATLIGFTVLGRVAHGRAMTKAGAQVGDRLLVTKPLGTAVVLAATRAGECPADWTEATLATMRQSNAIAASVLTAHGVRSCTDVSGFGLLGHLLEVLRASALGARLSLASVRALPGAIELLTAGWRSSADAANRRALEHVALSPDVLSLDPRLALLCDPQTSGGLLASVPAAACAAVTRALAEAGVDAIIVGDVILRPPGPPIEVHP
jgi:selenide,water dikinase